MSKNNNKYLALSGGVGGAKLVLGLNRVLEPDQLIVVANTGDDFEHLGLTICPDLDTVLYTLADWNNKELGWGQEGETWQFLDALERLEGETWFKLGDRDMATHITRTQLLASGHSLSEVVATLSSRMRFRIAGVHIMISWAATRPPPTFLSSVCEITAASDSESMDRTMDFSAAGNTSIIRSMVLAADEVCNVPNTMWSVSAASSDLSPYSLAWP